MIHHFQNGMRPGEEGGVAAVARDLHFTWNLTAREREGERYIRGT